MSQSAKLLAVAGGTGLVGRYAVEAAEQGGHAVRVLSRARGVDVVSGAGLEAALEDVDCVIDALNNRSVPPLPFFVDVAEQLQKVGARCGVRHIVTLSIVGIERAPDNPYYAAKVGQETATLSGAVPSSILRATQFHEFAAQQLRRNLAESSASVPEMRVQTVAARSVGAVLVELAGGAPLNGRLDLAGPARADLPAQARAFVARFGLPLEVRVSPPNPGVSFGATLPDPGARIEGPTFEAWLDSEDAASLARSLFAT